MKKLFKIAIVTALSASLLAGCGGSGGGSGGGADDTGPIRIGVFQPLTGANAGGGQLEYEGVLLAHSLRKEVLGRPVELITADNGSDRVQAATVGARLVEQDQVVAVVGSWGSSLSMAAGPLFEEAQIPAIGASCTNPLVTLGNDYYFRVCFIDPYQGRVMATYAYENIGARTAALVVEVGSDYSVGLAAFFEQAFIDLTGDPNAILVRAEYNTGDSDFNAQLTNIANHNPDVVFAPGNFTESALVIQQARQLGLDTLFLGGDTWETPEFINVGGAAVEGAVFSTFFDPDVEVTSKTRPFLDAFYASEFSIDDQGNRKEVAAVTALGFEAYNLLLDAIERAGTTDGPTLRDTIANTQNFEGVTGMVTFDENGDAQKSAVVKTVSGGRFTYLTTVEVN